MHELAHFLVAVFLRVPVEWVKIGTIKEGGLKIGGIEIRVGYNSKVGSVRILPNGIRFNFLLYIFLAGPIMNLILIIVSMYGMYLFQTNLWFEMAAIGVFLANTRLLFLGGNNDFRMAMAAWRCDDDTLLEIDIS